MKPDWRSLSAQVRWMLWAEWDPIGCGVPEDEYDAYVGPVVGKVMRGEGAEAIADFLDWASNENMECPQPRGRNLEFAKRLAQLRSSE
jgi:hypothetical protein